MRVLAIFPRSEEDWQILNRVDSLTSVFVDSETAIVPQRELSAKVRKVDRRVMVNTALEEITTSPPDLVLWFDRVFPVLWFARRSLRLAPAALITVVSVGKHQQWRSEDIVLRFGLWLRIIDSVVVSDRAMAGLRALDSTRYWFPSNPRSERLKAFLEARVAANRKSVLWVDPDLTIRSPSMRSLINSVGVLSVDGWSVRGLCYHAQPTDPPLEITKLPKFPLPRTLDLVQFFLACNLYRFVQTIFCGRRPAAILHTTCAYDLHADLVSVHFCHQRWLEFGSSLSHLSLRDWLALQFSRIYALLDRLQLRSKQVRLLLPVSRAIGEAIEQCYSASAPQQVLPNAFDESRFNLMSRERYRDSTRHQLGFDDTVHVFAFTSYGHYHRKGFWLIVEALRIMPDANNIRLMVIGGSARTLARLERRLRKVYPGFSQTVVFVGMTDRVEQYLAAADAFLFPSYFEAFCLAEIEAAAMSLPLLVTRHPGTEMIVRPGENGVFLEADAYDIAEKMRKFAAGEFVFKLPNTGEALNQKDFADRVAEIYESCLSPIPWRGSD
jgi:glycosyltransferase involved in cell wall biosynthesis